MDIRHIAGLFIVITGVLILITVFRNAEYAGREKFRWIFWIAVFQTLFGIALIQSVR